MAEIHLRNVTKSFQDTNAVTGFDLETRDGEFIVLVGPSGCGKSTTMRLLAGLERATEGEILIDGRDVTSIPPQSRDVAMVFQSYALYPHMTVSENMGFGLKLRKHDKGQIEKEINNAADFLNIRPLLKRKPKELSGGQRQRVALGRALVRHPKLFLMDEPLSNLDAKLRVETRAEIIKLHRRLGVTTFYVTHDQVEALTMGQRIVVMNEGCIQQADTPENVYNMPANLFVGTFIGSPAMNILKANVNGDKTLVSGPGFQVEPDDGMRAALTRVDADKVWLGIRPESVDLVAGEPDESGLGSYVCGTVELVELIGSSKLVRLIVGEATVTVQLPSDVDIQQGQDMTVVPNMKKVHAFGFTDEQNILDQ